LYMMPRMLPKGSTTDAVTNPGPRSTEPGSVQAELARIGAELADRYGRPATGD